MHKLEKLESITGLSPSLTILLGRLLVAFGYCETPQHYFDREDQVEALVIRDQSGEIIDVLLGDKTRLVQLVTEYKLKNVGFCDADRTLIQGASIKSGNFTCWFCGN
jgi:hypothetical protein